MNQAGSPSTHFFLHSSKVSLAHIMGKDYYKILGVSKDADDDAIKKAYRKQGE
jgi:DnaJ-domain-containing protein 1